jgi:predicted O-methyltransferase YrrM
LTESFDRGDRASLIGEKLAAARAARLKTPDDIPGWFRPLDRDLFREILAWQVANQPPADLVELGCYLGKSAVVMGESLQPTETFTVCDLFGSETDDVENATENSVSYKTLDREQFERNYLQFHPALPVVLQMSTAEILDHVAPNSARFIHVDASHLYEHVVADISAARTMLRPGGIVVFDDYRSAHAPGVAAAVWSAMVSDGLIPFALTPKKWYGTWDNPAAIRRHIRQWATADPSKRVTAPVIAGHRILRLREPGARLDRGR